jgi:hypothetical protein
MSQSFDASRSLAAFDQDNTLIDRDEPFEVARRGDWLATRMTIASTSALGRTRRQRNAKQLDWKRPIQANERLLVVIANHR